MKKVEVQPDEKIDHSIETLDQITNEWIKQQKRRFENPALTFRKKRNLNILSVFYFLKIFKHMMYKKRRSDGIINIFHLCIIYIAKFFKEMWTDFVCSIEYLLKIERYDNKAEKKK